MEARAKSWHETFLLPATIFAGKYFLRSFSVILSASEAFLIVTVESSFDMSMKVGSVAFNMTNVCLNTVIKLRFATSSYVIGIFRFSIVS